MPRLETRAFLDACAEAPWTQLRNAWAGAHASAQAASRPTTPPPARSVSRAAPEDKTAAVEGICVERALQDIREQPLERQLKHLLRYFKRLDAVLNACEMKLRGIKNRSPPFDTVEPSAGSALSADSTKTAKTLDTIVAYAQRIASHLRAPPEYADPTGTDPYCVPGYFFPCPDTATMRRSSLFYTHLPRTLPPTILFNEDATTPSLFWVTLATETRGAQILYAINQSTTWNLYHDERKPFVTAPGHYVIHSYCQATGHLVSETAVSQIDLSPRAAPQSQHQELHDTRKASERQTEPDGGSKKRPRVKEFPLEDVSDVRAPVLAQPSTELSPQAKFSKAEPQPESTQASWSTSNAGSSDIAKALDEKSRSDPRHEDVQLKEPLPLKTKSSGLSRFSGLFLSTGDAKGDSCDSQSDSETSEDE